MGQPVLVQALLLLLLSEVIILRTFTHILKWAWTMKGICIRLLVILLGYFQHSERVRGVEMNYYG